MLKFLPRPPAPPPVPPRKSPPFSDDDKEAILAYANVCQESSEEALDPLDIYVWDYAVKKHGFLGSNFSGEEVRLRYGALKSGASTSAPSKASSENKAQKPKTALEIDELVSDEVEEVLDESDEEKESTRPPKKLKRKEGSQPPAKHSNPR